MGPEFNPIVGAQGWQISNPPVLSTAPLLASLDIFQRAGIGRLREKSIALTGFLQRLVETRLPDLVDIVTPSAAEGRGCQLSLRIARSPAAAKRCYELLSAAGVVGITARANRGSTMLLATARTTAIGMSTAEDPA